MATQHNGLRRYDPPPHQRDVDALQAALRAQPGEPKRSLFKSAPPAPAKSEEPLDQRLSEELRYLVRRIEQVGGVLACEPILLHRHSGTLQSLDLINQILTHLAAVVESRDREAAVDRISLQELKGRLKPSKIVPIAG